jgi:hypothetical protein
VPETSLPHELRPHERRRLAIVCAIFAFVLFAPYVWAWLITPDGFVYSGLLFSPDDQNVHLAWARQAHDGAFFFRDTFTHESLVANPLFTNLFSWLLGVLSRVSFLPLIFWYHALRLIFAVLGLQWFARLVAGWTPDSRTRILAVVLAAFSMGSGMLKPLLPGIIFTDRPDSVTVMPEMWTFASKLVFPLFSVSLALIVLVLWQVQRARRGEKNALLLGAFGLAILSNIHTYDAIPLGLLLLAWTAMNFFRPHATGALTTPEFDRTRLAPLVISLGALPPLFYQLWVFKNSIEFQQKALTPTPPPPLVSVLVSIGFFLLLGAVGIGAVRSGKIKAHLAIPVLWVVVAIACAYAPISFARKMLEGVHWPLCVVAAVGLAALLQKFSAQRARFVAFASLAFLSVSSIAFALWCLDNAADNNRARENAFMPPLYLAQGDWAAMRALDQSRQGRDGVVLSLPFLSNYIPRETGRTVFAGHWAETLNFWDSATKTGKLADTQRFYGIGRAMSEDEARAWLQKNKIRFVVVGYHERRWMSELGGRVALDLPVWKQTGDTTIYEVR